MLMIFIIKMIRKEGTHMSLAMVAVGETKVVSEFRGKDEMKRHLQDLGLIKGEKVKVLGDNPSGLILMVKGVKIALNRGLASLIIVN
jgi:ferrous iron transport protein A